MKISKVWMDGARTKEFCSPIRKELLNEKREEGRWQWIGQEESGKYHHHIPKPPQHTAGRKGKQYMHATQKKKDKEPFVLAPYGCNVELDDDDDW
jgi:hypothetical protein